MPCENLNVLYITPFFVPVIGGVESVVYETSIGLVKNGHNPTVLTSSVANRPEREHLQGVEVIRTNLLDVPETGAIDANLFRPKNVSKFFEQIISELDVDVIHLHNYQMKQYAMFLISFLQGANTRQPPMIDTIHNTTEDPFAHYLLSYLPFSKVVALTSKSAFDLIKGGVPTSKIEVIPNTLDTDKFANADGSNIRKMLGVDDDEPIILFPSRLVGREKNSFKYEDGKGLQILLRALPLVKREIRNVKLLLIGNDPVYPDVVRQIREAIVQTTSTLGAKDSVLFLDRDLPQEQIPSVFAASDMVVSLGPTECFGMVFLEGMAAGKPVIGANSIDNGVPEVVLDGKTGVLVPANDPWSTAKNIIKLLSDKKKARQMGQAGRKWVKQNFDVDAVLPRLLDLYSRCI